MKTRPGQSHILGSWLARAAAVALLALPAVVIVANTRTASSATGASRATAARGGDSWTPRNLGAVTAPTVLVRNNIFLDKPSKTASLSATDAYRVWCHAHSQVCVASDRADMRLAQVRFFSQRTGQGHLAYVLVWHNVRDCPPALGGRDAVTVGRCIEINIIEADTGRDLFGQYFVGSA